MVARTRFFIRTDVRTRGARAWTALPAVGDFLRALSFVAAPASAAPGSSTSLANPAHHQHAVTGRTSPSAATPKAAPAVSAATPAHTFSPVAGAADEPQDPGSLGTGVCRSTPSGISVTNPKLGTLASNGGPTKTMALLTGSPAINHGSSPAPAVDQRA